VNRGLKALSWSVFVVAAVIFWSLVIWRWMPPEEQASFARNFLGGIFESQFSVAASEAKPFFGGLLALYANMALMALTVIASVFSWPFWKEQAK